jgi:hypothetical protein
MVGIGCSLPYLIELIFDKQEIENKTGKKNVQQFISS